MKEQGTPTSEGSRLTKDREVNTVEPDVVGHGGLRLLVIDDNPHDLQCIHAALNHPGLEILTGEDAEQGFKMFLQSHPSIVILGLATPKGDGENLLERMLGSTPE